MCNNFQICPREPVLIEFQPEFKILSFLVPLGVPMNLKVKLDDELNALASWEDVSKSRSSMRGKFLGYKVSKQLRRSVIVKY